MIAKQFAVFHINCYQVHPDIATVHLTAQYGNFYIVYSFTTSGSFSAEKPRNKSQVSSKDKPEKRLVFVCVLITN